ncbi:hypothetical protein NRB20_75130 [Nocardia sp. RB20]|uniref:Uncharacterized protein n=1 Tax=Nocardia macrotermitis TaxID=2585198 RepID=A0A7K0DFC3_9NOCA|nr:hypothetical protein [Nocardia macrotermitis]
MNVPVRHCIRMMRTVHPVRCPNPRRAVPSARVRRPLPEEKLRRRCGRVPHCRYRRNAAPDRPRSVARGRRWNAVLPSKPRDIPRAPAHPHPTRARQSCVRRGMRPDPVVRHGHSATRARGRSRRPCSRVARDVPARPSPRRAPSASRTRAMALPRSASPDVPNQAGGQALSDRHRDYPPARQHWIHPRSAPVPRHRDPRTSIPVRNRHRIRNWDVPAHPLRSGVPCPPIPAGCPFLRG